MAQLNNKIDILGGDVSEIKAAVFNGRGALPPRYEEMPEDFYAAYREDADQIAAIEERGLLQEQLNL